MRLLLLVFIIISCVPEQKSSSGGAINPLSPSRWNTNTYPISLKLSDSFTQFEKDGMSDVGVAWSDVISNQINFFDTTGSTTLTYHNSLNSYMDSEMGVYKAQVWPGELPSTALAITQIFGYRKYLGTSNEHVEIFHADIILNDVSYDFSATLDPGTYDLQTVVLHEMGHFIGLQHENDPFVDSVMYPSVTRSTIYRSPYNHDAELLVDLYGLGGVSAALMANESGHSILPNQNDLPEDTGPVEPVVIQTELYPDGSCLHKMDGKIIHRH